MKIISCHIENFGKLSDKTYEFTDGVNVICEENGAGKSTLAAFICAVFYGFAGEGKRSEIENERKRYKPWQGGVYGGEITFSAGGKSYIVTRLFGAKEKEDDFLLRSAATELPVTDYSSAIGEELFGLDRDSFLRTVFLTQNDFAAETTGSINAKLGNLAENTGDIETYEKVEKKLADAVNNLSPSRKTGQIARKKNTVAHLKEEVRRIPILKKAIEDQKDVRDRLGNEKNELAEKQQTVKQKISEVENYNAYKKDQSAYDAILSEFESRKGQYDRERAFFPGNVPTVEAFDAAVLDAARSQNLTENSASFTSDNAHIASFKDDEMLERVIEGWEERTKIYHSLAAKKENAEIFRQRVADTEAKLAERKLAADQRKARMEEKKKEKTGKALGLSRDARRDRILGILSILIGLCAFFGGLAMLRTDRLVAITLMIAGTLLGMLGLALSIVSASKKREAGLLDEQNDETQGMDDDFRSIAMEKKSLDESKARLAAIIDEIEHEEEILATRDAETGRFCEANGIPFREEGMVNALAEFKNAVRVSRENQGKRSEMEKAEAEITNRINAFFSDMSIVKREDAQQQLLELKDRALNVFSAEEELRQVKERKETFEAEHDIEEIRNVLSAHPEYDGLSFDTLSEEMTDIGDRMSAVTDALAEETGKLTTLRDELDALLLTEEELKSEEEELRVLEERLTVVELAKRYLDEAKVSFTARYMEPVKTGFSKYYDILAGITADDYVLDANMTLLAKEAGLPRNIRLLSQGRQDLLDICMRMALVDGMYEEEKPFVVMDDPFVNLDDDKVKSGFSLLDEIGREYQVIYFTCHRSRARRSL